MVRVHRNSASARVKICIFVPIWREWVSFVGLFWCIQVSFDIVYATKGEYICTYKVCIHIYIYVPGGELGMAVSSSWYRGCESLTSPGVASNLGWSRHMCATAATASSDGALSSDGILSTSVTVRKLCQKRPVYIKRDLQKRPTPLQISTCNQHICVRKYMSKETCIHKKRPIKETHSSPNRHLQPNTSVLGNICQKRPVYIKIDL